MMCFVANRSPLCHLSCSSLQQPTFPFSLAVKKMCVLVVQPFLVLLDQLRAPMFFSGIASCIASSFRICFLLDVLLHLATSGIAAADFRALFLHSRYMAPVIFWATAAAFLLAHADELGARALALPMAAAKRKASVRPG